MRYLNVFMNFHIQYKTLMYNVYIKIRNGKESQYMHSGADLRGGKRDFEARLNHKNLLQFNNQFTGKNSVFNHKNSYINNYDRFCQILCNYKCQCPKLVINILRKNIIMVVWVHLYS